MVYPVSILSGQAQFSFHFNFHLLPTQFSTTGVCCPVMTETTQPKRGGKAYHSVLEPHFDFIHQQRQRRKTWQEIADLLFSEKTIRVTLYAPYRFYRRKLKRTAKPNWENTGNHSQVQPARPHLSKIILHSVLALKYWIVRFTLNETGRFQSVL
jgi:hypothetical protein